MSWAVRTSSRTAPAWRDSQAKDKCADSDPGYLVGTRIRDASGRASQGGRGRCGCSCHQASAGSPFIKGVYTVFPSPLPPRHWVPPAPRRGNDEALPHPRLKLRRRSPAPQNLAPRRNPKTPSRAPSSVGRGRAAQRWRQLSGAPLTGSRRRATYLASEEHRRVRGGAGRSGDENLAGPISSEEPGRRPITARATATEVGCGRGRGEASSVCGGCRTLRT